MSSAYVAAVREDPAVIQARAEFAQCQGEHARLSTLAHRHAQKTGATYVHRAMTAALAGGQAAIASAANARQEVESLRRTVVGLATTAYERRLRDFVGASPGLVEAFRYEHAATPSRATTARTSLPDRVNSAGDAERQKAIREAAGHIRLLHDAMEVPDRLSDLAMRIANTTNTGARNRLLHELKRDASTYRSYALLLARAQRLGDEKLDAMVGRSRQQLDAGEIDGAITTLKHGLDRADSLEEAATMRASEEYVRRTLAEVLDGLGGALDGVALADGGNLIRWRKAEQSSAVATVRRLRSGNVRVQIEPKVVMAGAAGTTLTIAPAGELEEKRLCQSLPDLEARLVPRLSAAGLVVTSSELHPPRNPSGAAAIEAVYRRAQATRKEMAREAQMGGHSGRQLS